MSDEEARAAAFRAQETTRFRFYKSRLRALGGSRQAAKDLHDRYDPMRLALIESRGTPGGSDRDVTGLPGGNQPGGVRESWRGMSED